MRIIGSYAQEQLQLLVWRQISINFSKLVKLVLTIENGSADTILCGKLNVLFHLLRVGIDNLVLTRRFVALITKAQVLTKTVQHQVNFALSCTVEAAAKG